jgi:AraC-like DNA-binding protein
MRALHSTTGIAEIERFAYWRDAVCDTFVQLDCERLSERRFEGEIVTAASPAVNFSRVRSRDHQVTRTLSRIRQAREETVLISLFISGGGSISQDGRVAQMKAGDFACYDSTRPYVLHMPGDFEQLVLHMPRETMVNALGPTEALTATAIAQDSTMGALVVPFLRQVADTVASVTPETAARLSTISLALVTTAFGERAARGGEQSWNRTALLYRAKATIESALDEPDLNSATIARRLGVSQRYLQDLFHAEETTASDWIWERRLDKAARDLADPLLTKVSISEIAFRAGFSDAAHFSRRFRAAFDLSPREYRRRGRPTG